MLQNGSVQKAVRYLFHKSSVIGSFAAQSSGIMQSSMTSGLLLFSRHPVSKILQVSNVIKSQILFMV
jgi:hypothetical protein